MVPSAAIVAGLSGEAMAVNVSEQWVNEVVKNAALVAAGRATAGAISPKTIVLMEGVLRTMLLSKAKTLTAVTLVLSLSALVCVVLAKGQVKSEGEKAQVTENKKQENRPATDPPAEDDRIRPGDVLQIEATHVLPDAPLHGVFRVERRGTLALGVAYGRVEVKGLTLEEAAAKIQRYLGENIVKDPHVMVTRYDPVTGLILERRIELLEKEVAALREVVKKFQR